MEPAQRGLGHVSCMLDNQFAAPLPAPYPGQPPLHGESEGESIACPRPELPSISVDTQMPTHMPLNETQQYGECHGLFRTSAEHLQADQAVPKKT